MDNQPLISFAISTANRELLDECNKHGHSTHYVRKRRLLTEGLYQRQQLVRKSDYKRYIFVRCLYSDTSTIYSLKRQNNILQREYPSRILLISIVMLVLGGMLFASILSQVRSGFSLQDSYVGLIIFLAVVLCGLEEVIRFIVRYILGKSTMHKLDDIYSSYSGDVSKDYAIEFRRRRVRVLFDKRLFVIKGKRTRIVSAGSELRRAYLYMQPLSVFDLYKYIDLPNEADVDIQDSKKLALKADRRIYSENDEGWDTISVEPNVVRGRKWFGIYKCLFVIDNDNRLAESYLAVDESKRYNTKYMTYAERQSSGQQAQSSLVAKLNQYPHVLKLIEQQPINPIMDIISDNINNSYISGDNAHEYYD